VVPTKILLLPGSAATLSALENASVSKSKNLTAVPPPAGIFHRYVPSTKYIPPMASAAMPKMLAKPVAKTVVVPPPGAIVNICPDDSPMYSLPDLSIAIQVASLTPLLMVAVVVKAGAVTAPPVLTGDKVMGVPVV